MWLYSLKVLGSNPSYHRREEEEKRCLEVGPLGPYPRPSKRAGSWRIVGENDIHDENQARGYSKECSRLILRWGGRGVFWAISCTKFQVKSALKTATVVRTSSFLTHNARPYCSTPIKTKYKRTAHVSGRQTHVRASFFVQPNYPPPIVG